MKNKALVVIDIQNDITKINKKNYLTLSLIYNGYCLCYIFKKNMINMVLRYILILILS